MTANDGLFQKDQCESANKKNTKLCPHDSNRNHFDHSIALDGVYFIETNGRNRSLSSDLFPRKNRMGKLSGYDCRLSFLALCKKYIIHHCASSDR